jgi:CHAD domain-containing protein
VCEIEFELVAGPPQPLLGLAERWVQRHGLWLDVRTKSERGHRLALGLHQGPATGAAPAALHAAHTPGQALAAMLQAALSQVLPNAAELGNRSGTPEHLHQLRVGLRRLRSALQVFAPWAGDADAARALEQAWRDPFRQLGALRDADVVAQLLQQARTAAGAPPVQAAPPQADVAAADAAAAVVQHPAFSVCVLRSLRLALDAAQPPAAGAPALPQALSPADAAAALLQPQWRRARRAAQAFAAASPEQRHRLRRRLKRLRYVLEFLQPLLRRKPAAGALQALRAALEALGASNDALLAQAQLQATVEAGAADAGTWWALGWLAAQQGRLQRRAARRLARLPAAWPRAKSLSADR